MRRWSLAGLTMAVFLLGAASGCGATGAPGADALAAQLVSFAADFARELLAAYVT